MLPIDEHAKSGEWVWGLARSGATMRKIKWDGNEPLPGAHWVCTQGMIFDDDAFTNYLPVSWVENAGAMRAALETHAEWARREKAGPDYGGLTRDTHPDGERISSEWFYGNVDLCAKAEVQTTEALAETEWPKKEG